MNPTSHAAIFSSWYWIHESSYGKFRWSRGPSAQILFTLPVLKMEEQDTFFIELSLGAYQEQPVEVFFNDQQVGSFVHRGEAPSTYVFPIKSSQFRIGQYQTSTYNVIEFRIPNAVNPRKFVGQGWILAKGISFFDLAIYPENQTEKGSNT